MCLTWTCISAKCVGLLVLSDSLCVQDGGKALEEAMSNNSSLTECDIRLTEVEEQSASFVNQVVWTNQSLEQRRHARESKTKKTSTAVYWNTNPYSLVFNSCCPVFIKPPSLAAIGWFFTKCQHPQKHKILSSLVHSNILHPWIITICSFELLCPFQISFCRFSIHR